MTVKRLHAAVWGGVIHSCTGAEGGWGGSRGGVGRWGGSKQNRQKHGSGTFMYALHVLSRF